MRKSTIRRLRGRPVSRQMAHTLNELKSVERKLANLLEKVQQLELASNALYNQRGQSSAPETQEDLVLGFETK